MTRDLPPLRLLSVFATVLRAGGVQAAAAELNVSQPAISQALKQLEQEIGAPLFDRRTRPATATPAGELLEAAVREGLGRIAEAVAEIRRLQAGTDTVTIGCSIGVATYWLMPRLAGFSARHPDIAVNVVTTNQGAPRLAPGLDLTLRFGRGDWGDGEAVKLFDERVVPVGHPDLLRELRSGGDSERFHIDLSEAVLLHVDTDDPTWVTWSAYLRFLGLRDNAGKGRHFTNYVQATQAALMGQGLMLGWESITRDLVREGRLAECAARSLLPPDAYYLVASPRAARHPAARALSAWLRADGAEN